MSCTIGGSSRSTDPPPAALLQRLALRVRVRRAASAARVAHADPHAALATLRALNTAPACSPTPSPVRPHPPPSAPLTAPRMRPLSCALLRRRCASLTVTHA